MVERPMLQQPLHLGRFSFWRLVLVSCLATLLVACGSSIRERTVSDVRLLETSPSALETDDALAGLATAAPRTLFWIERERDVYDANLVARDLERIERYYRAHGYYDVKVVAARVESVGEREVAIEVHVTPGPRVTVRSVKDDPRVVLSTAAFTYTKIPKLTVGQPFEERELDLMKARIEDGLREDGYAYVKVRTRATVDLTAHAADVELEVDPGKRARFGKVTIVGLQQVPERKVRALLSLHEGTQYSVTDQVEARRALEELDLFSRVEITPDLTNPNATDVPLIVTLQEDKLRKLTLGGGTQIDSLQVEAHLRTGWEHKNFLGGARHFEISGKGGAVAFPNRLQTWDTLFRAPTRYLPVAKVGVALGQPALFNGRTAGRISVDYSATPLLYAVDPDDFVPEEETIIGYHKPSFALGLRRTFWEQRITLEPSYHLEAKIPFSYQGSLPQITDAAGSPRKVLENVWVSYPRLFTLITSKPGDFWKDRHRRDFTLSFRNSVELAGLSINGTHYFGGSVSDLKLEPEVRATIPLNGSRRTPTQPMNDWILATRLKVGFVLAPDYGGTLRKRDAVAQANSSDQQKLLFRAFYSGGSTSNRGYAPQAISPYGPVGFLIPTGVNCNETSEGYDPERCERPLGGFTLWEASAELRYLGLHPLGLVAFIDASDVTRDIGIINVKYPHVSVGPGVRYDSPVGLLRLDLGIRVPGWQAIGESGLPDNGSHGKELPSFPLAINLSLGEAF
jgi:outer membrane protein insertion porin family/translocation and assembly module TamA